MRVYTVAVPTATLTELTVADGDYVPGAAIKVNPVAGVDIYVGGSDANAIDKGDLVNTSTGAFYSDLADDERVFCYQTTGSTQNVKVVMQGTQR